MKKRVKRIGIIIMSCILCCSNLTVFGSNNTNVLKEKRQAYIIISNTEKKLKSVEDKYNLEIIERSENEIFEDNNITVANMTNSEAEIIEKEKGITVEEDFTLEKSSIKSKVHTERKNSNESIEWYLKAINADKYVTSKKTKSKNNKVKVAIIDSGIDYTEKINVAEQKNFIEGEDEISILYNDITGHGTAISGIVAAKAQNNSTVRGINENVELYSARIFGYENTTTVSRVIEAIEWAVEKDVNIISMSFGTTQYSKALEKVVDYAYQNGILIIAAAGNNGQQGTTNVEYPAAYDSVMAVGSTDTNNNLCSFSSTGKEIEVVAPGEQIRTTGAFDGVVVTTGTSMSVPQVVGVASVLWEKDLSKSNDFIRQLINYTANDLGDSTKYGNGIVDLQYALDNYDEFSEYYEPNVNDNENVSEDIVDENNNDLQVFDDINYVNGSWTKAQHTSFVEYASSQEMKKNGYTLTAGQIAALKVGAIFQDDTNLSMAGTEDNPYWHGSFKEVTNSNGNSYDCNYILAYTYQMHIARKWKKAKGYVKVTNSYVNTDLPNVIRNEIKADINSLYTNATVKKRIKERFKEYAGGLQWSDSYYPYLLCGMAIHNMTDTFAHSIYVKKNGNWSRIIHSSDTDGDKTSDPHDTDYYPYRFKAANDAAKNAIDNFLMGSSISDCPSDFLDYYVPKYYGNYKIRQLVGFSKQSFSEQGYSGTFEKQYYYDNIKAESYK